MFDKICAQCDEPFVAKAAHGKYCHQNCQMAAWRDKNREHNNAYHRAFRTRNPERIAAYNAKRRTGYKEIACERCGAKFLRNTAPKRFCSAECQKKAYWAENKESRYAAHVAWVHKNKPVVAALQKRHALAEKQRAPWASLIRSSKGRARILKLPHNLDNDWAASRWTGCCELTGIPFAAASERTGRSNRSLFPSIDRIEPKLGYTKDNCRIILWAVNVMRGDCDDAVMYAVAEALIKPRLQNVAAFLALPG